MIRQITNAKAESTSLGFERGSILTAWVYLKMDGSGQGFGGYCLDTYDKDKGRRVGVAYGSEQIRRILQTLGVDSWEKIPGTPCRIDHDRGKVYRIGHFIEDKWYDPVEHANETPNE